MKFISILVVLYSTFQSVNSLQLRNYQNGKFMIVGFLPITSGQNCGYVQRESVLLVEKFIYLVNNINAESRKLGFSVGYLIWDSCSKTNIAEDLAEMINIANGNTSIDGKIVAFVGPQQLENILKTSVFLSENDITQVIYTSKTRLLDNSMLFSSLTSVAPSISDTTTVLSMLVKTFNWRSINVVTSNDMYKQEFLSLLSERLQTLNVCVTKSTLIDNATLKLQIHKVFSSIKSSHQVSVTVILSRPEVTAQILEEARRQNVTGHVWIGTERWTDHKMIADKYGDVLEGGLSIVNNDNHDDAFQKYFNKLWRGVQYGDWLRSLLGSNASSCLKDHGVIDPQYIRSDRLGLLTNAVKGIGFSLEIIVKNMTKGKPTNITIDKRLYRQFRKDLSNVINKYVSSQPRKLIIINYQKTKAVTVGQWISNDTTKDVVSRSTIRWPGGTIHAPFSGPVSPCKPGTSVKMDLKGCGWTCVKCPLGTFSQNYSSPACKTCPKDKIPNALQTSCLLAEKEYILFFDVYGICILSSSALGFLITVAVLGIFVKYQNTPVIKASNIGFCLFTLVLLLVWFLSSILFLGEPKDWSCKLTSVGVPLVYTSVSALLLTKTKRLLRIFSTLKQNRFLSNYWYSFVACSIVLVQVIFSAVYLVFFPPEQITIHHNDLVVSTYCSRNLGIEVASFTYNCLLAFLCALFAVKSRNLPETYTEAKHICLTMLSYMLSWMIYFFGYYGIQRGKLKTAVPTFGVIVGAFAVLFFIFVPKMRVIFFAPEKNTKTAAMAATRKYSIDVACGIQLSISQTSRSCERRHTLATLPAYHEPDLSTSVQCLDRNKNQVESRSSPESIGDAIREVDDIAEEDSVSVDVRGSFSIPLDNGITIKKISYVQANGIR